MMRLSQGLHCRGMPGQRSTNILRSHITPPWYSKNAKTAPAATTLSVPAGWTIENGYYYTPMNNYKLMEMQARCFLDVIERVDN